MESVYQTSMKSKTAMRASAWFRTRSRSMSTFERGKEALAQGVVVGIAAGAHGGAYVRVFTA